MDTNPKPNKSGQALVEFCIGLIAILAVIGGIFLIGDLSLARVETRVEATRKASRLSMLSTTSSVQPIRNYIRSVTEGLDNQPYSQDDSVNNGGATDAFLTFVEPTQPSVLNSYAPTNIFANMQNSDKMMANTGLVKGEDSRLVDIRNIPVIRKFFIDQESIDITETVWSIRTGDLY